MSVEIVFIDRSRVVADPLLLGARTAQVSPKADSCETSTTTFARDQKQDVFSIPKFK